MRWRGWALAAALLAAAPGAADAQMFLAARPHPPFQVGPLLVRATVTPELGPVPVDVMFSIVVPPGGSVAGAEQDLYLVWPSAVAPAADLGLADPDLETFATERGLSVIESGRLAFDAVQLYGAERARAPIGRGAPFVTVVRDGPLGLTAPATWIRIPWDPRLVNRAYLARLRLQTRGLLKEKPATWFERTFTGPRHRLVLSFNEVRHRAIFPLYLEHRDRVVRLSEDPAQLLVDFGDNERLRIDELSPASARRQVSETRDRTDTVSLFIDRSEGLTPQSLTVQFGYFTGLQSWAPVLIPTLFFVLGNVAAVLVRHAAERVSRRLAGRFEFGRAEAPRVRQTGRVLDQDTLGRIKPGVTTYQEVLAICGPEVEESRRLGAAGDRHLVYRGRRLVPVRRRVFGWFSTVGHWELEHHEVDVLFDGDVVRDVHARVRRSRVHAPAAE
ncbi:MAG TPA: hypothetical protein VNN07_12830 [Candidatus Tectomicrobia bacterium]|nr:hypothetical protein [Candidatus Tectomicrobia bacterium]